MRIAFFSPLPPAKSGIADYSAALLEPMKRLAEIDVFSSQPDRFDSSKYEAILYQLGNNADHAFVYESALEYPGTVVLHEANLHHLIADLTIRRDDWDGYMREIEFEGGEAAMVHGRRVRALEIGPDYDGLPMLKRILSRSKSAIIHSRFVEGKLREAQFSGPVAVIPHGTWIPRVDGSVYRAKLGLQGSTDPLIGIFGHLKPYKRIHESLRAFKLLIRLHPEAKLILVGDPHPALPLESTIQSLGLEANARVIGHVPIEDFTGYLAACDIVLNLRYPTVGETSGTLHRALGLGRAVLVSDIGSFAELPDDICLKVKVGAGEEDLIFEYLNLFVSRPDLARTMGDRARAWVERECTWEHCAKRYIDFLRGDKIADVRPANDITPWTETQPDSGGYVDAHLARFVRTLEITPRGTEEDRILEMGAYMQITPALHYKLGYGEVRGCYFGPPGRTERKTITSEDGRSFTCEIDLFDAEKDRFPYPDDHFSTVLCCELIEHLPTDPMHAMTEIHRILKPGGHLVLTTPNITSLRAIAAIIDGYHPGFFPSYLKPEALANGDSRHNREYAPREVQLLLHDAGFEVVRLETGPFKDEPKPQLLWIEHLLDHFSFDKDLRGDGIYAVCRKTGAIRERYPDWLYSK